MPAATGPDLKKYMDKKLQSAHITPSESSTPLTASTAPPQAALPPFTPHPAVKLNGNRHITGTLRGFDQFMNLVIDEAVEQAPPPPHLARAPPACTPFKHAHARAPA